MDAFRCFPFPFSTHLQLLLHSKTRCSGLCQWTPPYSIFLLTFINREPKKSTLWHLGTFCGVTGALTKVRLYQLTFLPGSMSQRCPHYYSMRVLGLKCTTPQGPIISLHSTHIKNLKPKRSLNYTLCIQTSPHATPCLHGIAYYLPTSLNENLGITIQT